jgi:hypothetical protein
MSRIGLGEQGITTRSPVRVSTGSRARVQVIDG